MIRSYILFLFSLLFVTTSYAELNIVISKGMAGAVPIAVNDFSIKGLAPDTDLSAVIRHDLRMSGRFDPVDSQRKANVLTQQLIQFYRQEGIENLIRGKVEAAGNGRFHVSFELVDVYKARLSDEVGQVENGELVFTKGKPEHLVIAKTYKNIKAEDLRALAHHVSDVIFENLTGIRGAFSTKIAYVLVNPTSKGIEYKLEIADADGYNPKTLMSSKEPIMSPSWSPDGKKLAFVSFENKQSEIYILDVKTGQRELLSSFRGINGAPSWSPDGRNLALVLSKSGSPKLYMLNVQSKALKQLTKGYSIDTEPTFEPSGKSLLFTSNRGGKPQIYRLYLESGKIERVTFEGDYNAKATLSQDGKQMVMLHRRQDGRFRIATQDLRTGQVRLLTQTRLDESPSLAPNGAMVLYGTKAGHQRVLGLVTIDGRGHIRLPAREGSVQEPAWSPFLS